MAGPIATVFSPEAEKLITAIHDAAKAANPNAADPVTPLAQNAEKFKGNPDPKLPSMGDSSANFYAAENSDLKVIADAAIKAGKVPVDGKPETLFPSEIVEGMQKVAGDKAVQALGAFGKAERIATIDPAMGAPLVQSAANDLHNIEEQALSGAAVKARASGFKEPGTPGSPSTQVDYLATTFNKGNANAVHTLDHAAGGAAADPLEKNGIAFMKGTDPGNTSQDFHKAIDDDLRKAAKNGTLDDPKVKAAIEQLAGTSLGDHVIEGLKQVQNIPDPKQQAQLTDALVRQFDGAVESTLSSAFVKQHSNGFPVVHADAPAAPLPAPPAPRNPDAPLPPR